MTQTGRLMNYYHTNANKVRQFMEAFGQEVKKEPEWADEDTTNLRVDLIDEEFNELFQDASNYLKKTVMEELFHEYTIKDNKNK